jgi:integrase
LLYRIDNYRDYAMVLVMLYGGLRVSETYNIDKEDIDFDSVHNLTSNTCRDNY